MSGQGDLESRIITFLDTCHVMSLSTTSDLGPHAASLFYVRDGLALAWVSSAEARHSRDVMAEPRVAATIAPDVSDYAAIKGLQIAGLAEAVTGVIERARLLGLLGLRYAFLNALADAPAKMAASFASATVYRLKPQRLVLIDNSLGFGHKETLTLP